MAFIRKNQGSHTAYNGHVAMSDKSWLFVGANLSASTSLEWCTLFSPMLKMPQLMTQQACFLKGRNLLKKSHCFGTSPLDSTCFFWKAWQLSTICCGVSSCLFTHLTFVGAWHYHLGEECGRDLQGYQGVGTNVLKSSFCPVFSAGVIKWDPYWGDQTIQIYVISRDFHGLPLE